MAEKVETIAPPLPVPPLHRSPELAPALLAVLLINVSLFVLFPYAMSESPPGAGVMILIVTIAMTVMIVSGTAMIRRAAYRRVQEDRDGFAEEIHAILRAGGVPPPFSLYLRPFFTDGELTANEGFYRSIPMTPSEIADIGQRRDVERAAAHALERHAPLVTLGRPEPRLGAGRIATTEEDWFATFQLLVRHAARIVIVPIGQPGTLAEIGNIAQDPALLAKTVFVRPANRKRRHFRFGPDGDLKSIGQMWDWTRAQLHDLLPAFPKFRGGTRLLAFPPGRPPVEYWGDGMTSVQQRSGVRDFLVEGRTDTPRLWLLAILLPALSFAWMGYIRWDIWTVLDQPSYGSHTLDYWEIVAGFAFIELMTAIVMAFIGLRSLVTGDIPWRVMRVVIVSIIMVFLSGYLHSTWLENTTRDLDASVPDTIIWQRHFIWMAVANLVYSSNFKFLLLFTLCAMAGKAMTRPYIAVWAIFGPLLTACMAAVSWSGILADGALRIVLVCGTSISLFAIMMAPFLSRALPRWKMAAAAGIAAALLYLALFVDASPILGFLSGSDPCSEGPCRIARETGRLWMRFGGGLLGVLPILAFPFILRLWPGVGRREAWAAPLDRYPE